LRAFYLRNEAGVLDISSIISYFSLCFDNEDSLYYLDLLIELFHDEQSKKPKKK